MAYWEALPPPGENGPKKRGRVSVDKRRRDQGLLFTTGKTCPVGLNDEGTRILNDFADRFGLNPTSQEVATLHGQLQNSSKNMDPTQRTSNARGCSVELWKQETITTQLNPNLALPPLPDEGDRRSGKASIWKEIATQETCHLGALRQSSRAPASSEEDGEPRDSGDDPAASGESYTTREHAQPLSENRELQIPLLETMSTLLNLKVMLTLCNRIVKQGP